MSDPDELYTLRAQYLLGHYQMAIEEAKSVARRPGMSPALKAEREIYLAKAYIASHQYDTVTNTETPALQALSLQAQYEAANGNASVQETILDQLKSLLGGTTADPSVQLTVASVLLSAGQTKEALQAVHSASTNEQALLLLQIYLKMDRLDLASQQAQKLRTADEDSIPAQLANVYVSLARGSSAAGDALHLLTSLSEQYGNSPLLLNLQACAYLQQGDYVAAEQALDECVMEFGSSPLPDTLVNRIACCVHQNKSPAEFVAQLQQAYPTHPFCEGLERVTTAFDREAIKYKV